MNVQLIRDNTTRWNSFYISIGRAINVKERINKFCKQHTPVDKRERGLKDDILTPKHWYHLERLHSCLETFYAATLATEGNKSFLYDWYPTMTFLLNEIDSWRQEFAAESQETSDQASQYLSGCLEHSWAKCEKYVRLADDTPIIYAAVVMNPAFKMQWVYAAVATRYR